MADTIFVTFLLEKLPQILLQEVNLPSDVSDQIASLIQHLKKLHDFLSSDSDFKKGKRIEHESMAKIRETVHEAEDLIDTYIYNLNRQRQRNLPEKVFKYGDHSKMLHDVASKVKTIQPKIEEITRTQLQGCHGMEFGNAANNNNEEAEADLHKRRRDVEENDVVGFEDESSEVIDKLTKGRKQREVISIIGMGGLGKTTLARKVYKDNMVTKYFNVCVWVNVNNDYKPNQLLLKLVKQLVPNLDVNSQEVSTDNLRMLLQKSLKRRKYIVVLDDIWEPKTWDDVKDAFPDDQNGSRILITSRSHQVANQVSGSNSLCQYHLPFLSKHQSWELFSKRVFREREKRHDEADLEVLGRQMAESCDGLPLSVCVLAGVLEKQERSKAQWSLVVENEIWHLLKPEARCRDILELSYDYLPRHLKLCFLYLGFYPKDRVENIPVKHLIRLWVAEGLVQEDTGNKQPEDVAELYLQELISRSLIQIASRRTDGGVKSCRIHDLLRGLCIEESKKVQFYEVYTKTSNTITTLNKPRRLSLSRINVSSYLSSSSNLSTDHSSVRSLICSVPDEFPKEDASPSSSSSSSSSTYESQIDHYWQSLVKIFKLVRVLDISSSIINTIPTRIRKLVHLRYLRLDINKPESSLDYLRISDHISELRNLETLDIRGLPLDEFPIKLHKLKRLRHVLMCGPVKMPNLDEPLESLQSLSTVALQDHTGSLFSSSKFPNLRKLGLHYKSSLQWVPHEFWPTLQSLCYLRTLKIIGTTMLPEKVDLFPPRLTKITLVNLKSLEPNVMVLLGGMPNLEILKVSGNTQLFYEFEIDCKSKEEFGNLKVFHMRGLACTDWNMAEGAMGRLQSLVINKCKKLRKLPDELWRLANLQDVQVSWPSKSLADMLRKVEKKDGCRLAILNDEVDK